MSFVKSRGLIGYCVSINSNCISCKRCMEACPRAAIVFRNLGLSGLEIANPKICAGCLCCLAVCPKNAINISTFQRKRGAQDNS